MYKKCWKRFAEKCYQHQLAPVNINSVQGKIESNMAYPDMFVQLATTRFSAC